MLTQAAGFFNKQPIHFFYFLFVLTSAREYIQVSYRIFKCQIKPSLRFTHYQTHLRLRW